MTGRKGLTLVTALTVASLLLGGGALNALAEEHGNGGRGHGNDKGKAEHQRLMPPVVFTQADQNRERDDEDERGNNSNKNVQRHHDDDEKELVTKPARVTEIPRPHEKEHDDEDDGEKNNGNHEDDDDGPMMDGSD